MSHTLVLSPNYQPVNYLPLSTVDWQQAIRLFFLEKVTVLEWYDDWTVRSAKLEMRVPAVVVTGRGFGKRGSMRFNRQNLYLRDLYQCQYCGNTFDSNDLTIDHVTPRCLGGKTEWTNVVSCCQECNSNKGSKYWRPLREPYRPDYWNLVSRFKQINVPVKHSSWYQYLGIAQPSTVATLHQ
jgi:5-methylcytosine-specific restriction endonuclease McrA